MTKKIIWEFAIVLYLVISPIFGRLTLEHGTFNRPVPCDTHLKLNHECLKIDIDLFHYGN